MTSVGPASADVGAFPGRPEHERAVSELRRSYCEAQPWPHVVIDQFVDPEIVEEVERAELPHALALNCHRSARQIKAESAVPGSLEARTLLAGLTGPRFVAFVETVTGLSGLVADPTHWWGGVHATPGGGFQAVHNDFSRHPLTGLHHRVNALLYLNSRWADEWGGGLELWGRDLQHCGRRIAPVGGRLVIFETDRTTYHGVPDPIVLPSGMVRLSLASYFYTDAAPPDARSDPLLRRPRRPTDPRRIGVARPRDALLRLRQIAARSRHH